jgi:hypothetical protein
MPASPGKWVGVKAGLFAICEESTSVEENGSITVPYFVFEPLV